MTTDTHCFYTPYTGPGLEEKNRNRFEKLDHNFTNPPSPTQERRTVPWCFKAPSPWRNSRALRHNLIRQFSWASGSCNHLYVVPQELRGCLLSSSEEGEGEPDENWEKEHLSAGRKKKKRRSRTTKSMRNKTQSGDWEDEVLMNSEQQSKSLPYQLVASLKACAKKKDLHKGSRIHAGIAKTGLLEKNVFLGSILVSMYAKCGSLAKAQEVFDKLQVRDEISWSALIAGYAQHGYGEQALKCLEYMQLEGFIPNAVTYVCILKACGSIGALDKGKELHAEVAREGLLETNVIVGNALINMYAKGGLLAKAQEVFDSIPMRNVASWNALMAGYVQEGNGKQALKCFKQMQLDGLSPNKITFLCILKACGSIRAADMGKEIHAAIIKEGLLKDVVVSTALIDMYAKCGLLTYAQELFDELPSRNIVSWNVLMDGYVQHGHGELALMCFKQMQLEGLSPDAITFVCALKACGSIGAAEKGKEIHAHVVKEGLLKKNEVVGTALVDMYGKCGLVMKAQEVFDQLPGRSVILWNALLAGYAQRGHGEQALKCFEKMQSDGWSPDAVTFVCMLKACGSIGAADKGKELHGDIVREGLLRTNFVVGNALVDMYAKCGLPAKAQEVFDELPFRSVVTWSVLMAGYAQHGDDEQVLNCFDQMQLVGLTPDPVTFVYALKACGNIGAADKGKEIHARTVRAGLVDKDVVVGTALVEMYAKCGLLEKAHEVFDELPVRNIVTWSVLMAACTLLGKVEHVFHLFDKMIGDGIEPNLIIFNVVLNACSHNGLLDRGQMYLERMSTEYGIVPNLEHYSCMVDLFARAGHLSKAISLIKEMPYTADLTMWHTVLAACQRWGNMKLGRLAFEHALQLDEKDPAAYVCMRNIYAAAGRQCDADKVEAMRMKKKVVSRGGGVPFL